VFGGTDPRIAGGFSRVVGTVMLDATVASSVVAAATRRNDKSYFVSWLPPLINAGQSSGGPESGPLPKI